MKSIIWFVLIACQLEIVLAGPLLNAAKTGNSKHVDRVLKSGGDIHERGQQGEKALHWMVFHGDVGMVRLLLDAGSDVNESVNSGTTPLHLAAYKGHLDVAKLLIEYGANVNARTKLEITPLDWADRNGHPKIAELLKTNGAIHGQIASNYVAKPDHQKAVTKNLINRPQFTNLTMANLVSQTFTVAPTTSAKIDNVAPVAPIQKESFRIQLGAVSSESLALETWRQYHKQHQDILDNQELILDTITLKGKTYYRVQTGPFSKLVAESVCNQLNQRRQPCIVVNTR